MDPIAIHVGPLAIHWYGLLIMGGVLAGAAVAARLAKAAGDDPEHLWNALTWCLLLGIVGARLYHVVSSPQGTDAGLRYYLQNPSKILAIWEGGLGIYGAVAGGALGLYLYTRLNSLSFWRWADFTVPGLALGQAIGRWGNYVNQELYGYPTDLPWGIYIDPAHRLAGFEAYERFHPTFLYESLWNLLVLAVLLWVGRRFGGRLLEGDLLSLYGVLYPVGRILVETQRPDAWLVAGMPAAQWVAVGAIALSLGLALASSLPTFAPPSASPGARRGPAKSHLRRGAPAIMDITHVPSRRRDVVGAASGLKRATGVSGRRKMMVATTVLVVLSLAAWAMTGFYGDRPSALPRTGNPMPALPTVKVAPGLQEELARITAALTRRDADDEMLIEAVYSTPELFAALSRHEAALQRDRESEQLLQTYQRDHELDRYLVFTVILGSDISGLEEYRPETKSRLRTANGREVTAESWVEIPSLTSDYHRIGVLHFPRFTVDGQSLLPVNDDWLELVLSAPDGRERVLRWELPIAYPSAPTT